MDNLTAKQRRFVAEYLKDLNATQAAIRAGYSAKTARSVGSENLSKPAIAAEIAGGQAQLATASEIETARIVEHQGWIATFDPAELYDEQDVIKPVRQLPKHVRCCLASIDVLKVNLVSGDQTRQTVVRYKFHDKNRAAELEYRRRGILKDKIEVSGTLDLVERLASARQRLSNKGTHD